MLTYPWKCTVLHRNHLGNTWKPLVLMTRHFDYCPSASEDDNQSVRSSAPVVSRCFPGGYNVKLYISRGRLAWWLLAFLHSETYPNRELKLSLTLVNVRICCNEVASLRSCVQLLFKWHLVSTTTFSVKYDNSLSMLVNHRIRQQATPMCKVAC